MAHAAKTGKTRLSKAEVNARERRALEALVSQGLLRQINQVPVPAGQRRTEHPPIPIKGEPVSSLIVRERR